ncbi:uncharacterized protein C8A04DRAFT_33458 [Dichotomopilus funicola]|uniref:Uncharacterized protein n=1 Tax=Dichotomopilus funicola TaxID=1934379 RepID=A0AAN6UTQ8_9PEZI|nr:hypothetical protein C8A04DRAFT_33458 [Dichotomopilus funicola]
MENFGTPLSPEGLDLGLVVPEYISLFPHSGEGILSLPVPGVRCPTCAANGEEVWVVPGLLCAKCRTPAPDSNHELDSALGVDSDDY